MDRIDNRFQRVGSLSNAHAGREFEEAARLFFAETGIHLQSNFVAQVGYSIKKPHRFDLGSDNPPILVECKSFKWTSGGNSPSAKLQNLNEAMLYFSVCPQHYRRILFVLKHMRKELSLASHYIKTRGHLIGPGVEVWEFDLDLRQGERVF
jgi:hypothetical protein